MGMNISRIGCGQNRIQEFREAETEPRFYHDYEVLARQRIFPEGLRSEADHLS